MALYFDEIDKGLLTCCEILSLFSSSLSFISSPSINRCDIQNIRAFCRLAMPQHVTAFDEIEKQFCTGNSMSSSLPFPLRYLSTLPCLPPQLFHHSLCDTFYVVHQ